MPRQSQTAQPDVDVEAKPFDATTLAPKVQTTLRQKLLEYQRNSAQIKKLEAAQDALKAEVGAIQEEVGETSMTIDGFTVTLVAPTRSTLNKKRLIALGCAPAWLVEATDITPTASYYKITQPGEKTRNKTEEA